MCPSTIKAKIQQLEEVLAFWNAKLDEFTASNEKYGIESARYHINEIEKKIKRQNKRLAEAEEAARRIDVMWGRA